MPPGMLSGDPLPSQPSSTANDTSDIAVISPCKCAASVSASSPPQKRRRGRPQSSTKKGPKPANGPLPAMGTNSMCTRKKKDPENTPPLVEVIDSDEEIEKTANRKTRHWQAGKKTHLFNFILGPDEEGQHRFTQYKTDPSHVYERASKNEFEGDRSPQSVKSVFEHAFKTYAYIHTFDGFTGNGGRDEDLDDPTVILKHKLSTARSTGIPLGALKASTIEEWEKEGWQELFDFRCGVQ
ncbi:hypothetical protein DFH08DRAFT_960257 [Mycena albidolilacea]|uniref:Uncharacterized protein n=1 Tax=Mycena albidolilacea TaxID=1033008 RepID=A0AAD7ER06_9AGAR|nr:hypothetical protein DFH08DRAFT_960257 [Mycena albidolilacea]